MHDLTCAEVADAAPRFALDILEPQARADVAAHLLRCPTCRVEVSGMQESAARLLDVGADDRRGLPWAEEPYGPPDWPGPSEQSGGRPVAPGRRRLRLVLTLAAAALLMVGTTFGPEIQQASSRTGPLVARADILAGDRQVGTVSIFAGSGSGSTARVPALEIVVEGLAGPRVTCELVGADGRVTPLGTIRLYGGRATWATGYRLSTPGSTGSRAPADILLLDTSGHVVARAALT